MLMCKKEAIHPRHIIQSTGFAGEPNVPDIQGLTKFRGPLIHSAAFRNAKGSKGKKVVIVGACNSAQDAARDYLLNGADVTIIQRSSTSITTRDIVTQILTRSYNEGNVSYLQPFVCRIRNVAFFVIRFYTLRLTHSKISSTRSTNSTTFVIWSLFPYLRPSPSRPIRSSPLY